MQFKPLTEQAEWEWVRVRAWPMQCSDTQGIVAYNQNGIQAVAIMDTFGQNSCSVHWAIDNPLVIRRGFLHEVCRHIFQACGKDRFFGTISEKNEKSLKFARHIGAVELTRVPHGFATNDDLVIMCMNKEGCRWINQTQQEEAA